MRTSKRVLIVAALAIVCTLSLTSMSSAQPWGLYSYPYPYPYRAYMVDPGAAMRLEVTPNQAEVYVDGYYAGIVDDFDGTFQRLRARPGPHEIVLYLDGYRTVRQQLYLTPRNTMKLKLTMERLGAAEQQEARPAAPPPPPRANASAYGTVVVRVQPIDADVLVDGQVWHTQDAQDRLVIEVAEGPHTFEIRKAGYRSFVTQLHVRRGESFPLNISLRVED